jgi:hypothetical protein
MSELSCKLTGDKAVMRMFAELPAAAQDRVMKPLLNKGARLMAQAAKGAAPDDSGLLKLSLGASNLKVYGSGSADKLLFITVGARRGYRRAVTVAKRGRTLFGFGMKRRSKAFTQTAEQAMVRNPTKYLSLVEGGRSAITASGKVLYSAQSEKFFGKSASAVAANPFMEEAFSESRGGVVSQIESEAEAGIVAEAEKLAK